MGGLTKSKIFFLSTLGFLGGIILRSLWSLDFFIAFIIFIVSIVLLAIFKSQQRTTIVGLILLGCSLGITRYIIELPKDSIQEIKNYNNQDVNFVGVVVEEPDARIDKVKLTVEAGQLTPDPSLQIEGSNAVRGRVLVTVPLYPKYNYGDKLEISCYLKDPEPVEDFAYDKYLARYGVYSICKADSVKLIYSHQASKIKETILGFKNYTLKIINQILPEPESSFLAGLLVGARQSIPEEVTLAFNRTGTTHIIAISGYNITIIVSVLMSLALGLGLSRKRSWIAIVTGIIFFVILTGASSSVVRAGVMGLVVILARQVGRPSQMKNILSLTALLMVIANPFVLMFDIGFQLSFMATLGLVYLSPILEKYFKKLPEKFGLKESLVSTISAIIMTTPLSLYYFGRFSIVAPLANMLVLPVIPLAMLIGFINVLIGMFSIGLGQLFGWISWVVLKYVIAILSLLSSWQWASVEVPKMTGIGIVVFYGILIWFILRNKRILNI